ncbi:MAG: hypothetical protein ABIO91_02555 [Pyrinomonadaceae bacterium]
MISTYRTQVERGSCKKKTGTQAYRLHAGNARKALEESNYHQLTPLKDAALRAGTPAFQWHPRM